MAVRTVLATCLPPAPEPAIVQRLAVAMQRVGLQAQIAEWVDDLDQMAWYAVGAHLGAEPRPDVWLIVAGREQLAARSVRYGLSLTTAMVRRNDARTIVACLGLDGAPDADSLPFVLRDTTTLDAADGSWAAKLIAAGYARGAVEVPDYRLGVIAHPHLGQWLEVGPRHGTWSGALLGVDGEATIKAHAVGTAGRLPKTSTLEYQTRGFEFEVGGVACTGWAVRNAIDAEHSYYVQVEGHPGQLVFGPHPESDDPEMFVLPLV